MLHSVAMNPSLPRKEFTKGDCDFFEKVREVRRLVGNEMPLYIQSIGENQEDILSDAKRIRDEIGGELAIKIPACTYGFRAITGLKNAGFTVSCTAVMNLNQALLAAESGADVIAVYTSRLDDTGTNAVFLLDQIHSVYENCGYTTDICAASIKNPLMIEKYGALGIDFIAAGLPVLQEATKE